MNQVTTPSLDYIRKLYAPQDSLLASIDEVLQRLKLPMHIGAEEGKLLQLFIVLHNVKKIVEIGTLAGYSAIWMARALPPDGQLFALNRDTTHVEMAQHFFDQCEVKERITQIAGDAHTTLPTLNEHGPFDLVFIDADKISYNDYLDWAEENVRKFGLIIADNTLLSGSVALDSPPTGIAPTTWNNMQRFNARLADANRYFSTMIPTEAGLTVAIKLF